MAKITKFIVKNILKIKNNYKSNFVFQNKTALQQELSGINLTPMQNEIVNLGRVINSTQSFVSGITDII